MYVGTQHFGTSRTEMEFLVRHGVNHFDASVADMEVDTLRRYREEAAAYGVELEMVHVKPMLNVTMANDPERDREIDGFCRYIENASQAGLRGLNLTSVCSTPRARWTRAAHRAFTWPRWDDVQHLQAV